MSTWNFIINTQFSLHVTQGMHCVVVEVMKHALKQSLLEIIVNDNLGRAVIILIGELFGLIVAHRKLTQQRS